MLDFLSGNVTFPLITAEWAKQRKSETVSMELELL